MNVRRVAARRPHLPRLGRRPLRRRSRRAVARLPRRRCGRRARAQIETTPSRRKQQRQAHRADRRSHLSWANLSSDRHGAPEPAGCTFPRGCGHLRPPDAARARSGRRLARKQPRRSSVLRVISRWLPRRMIAGSLRQPTMWATSGSRKPATSPAVSVATTCGPGQLLALAVQRAASGALRREPRPPLAPTGVPVRERTRGRSSAASSAQTMVRAGRRREARKRHSHQRANATGD
jgi:hypothetical protein